MPAIEWRILGEDCLLARMLEGRIEWRCGLAFQHVGAGRVDIGEIGSERPSQDIDGVVRGCNQVAEADERSHQHRPCHKPHASAVEPGTGAQNVQYLPANDSRPRGWRRTRRFVHGIILQALSRRHG